MNRRQSALLAIVALFASSVGGAWAWFQTGPRTGVEQLQFVVRETVDGWRFEARPLGAAVQSTLATPHLFNGVFGAESRRPVTVFAAEWSAAEARQMVVVQHTPDVCWVGAGWIPVQAGQPERIAVVFDGRPVSFECRVFGVPGSAQRELVLWCTLVGGQVLEEADRWSLESDPARDRETRFASAGRRMAAGQFLQNVREHRAATAHKQFVRLSVPIAADWREGLRELEAFAPRWLRFRTSVVQP